MAKISEQTKAGSTAARRTEQKVPQVMQMEALECGAACLTMVLAYYGRWVPLEQVRADCGVSRDGSKAANVLKAARNYGLSAKGKSYSVEALRRNGSFPSILFWNFNHFVVLTGFGRDCAYVNDPARGQIKVPLSEFENSFTGIVLEFEKTEAFEEGGQAPSSFAFARQRLEGMGGSIAFVMLTAAIVSVATIASTALARVFLDRILSGDNPDWLLPLTAIMLALAIIYGVVSIINAVYLLRIQGKIAVVSSSRFMRHLLHLPVGFYAQRMVGDLQQRQTSNENIAFILIGQLAPVLINIAMLLLYLVIMLQQSVVLTLVGVATVVLNALVAGYISRKRVNISRSMTMDAGKLYATTVGGIEMIETIKAAGAENGYFGRWAGYQASVNEGRVRLASITEYLGSIPLALTQLANITVLVLGIWLIVQGSFSAGALLAFQGFITAFMTPVTEIINLGQMVQEMQTQMERVEDVMRYPVDVAEEPVERTGDERTGDGLLFVPERTGDGLLFAPAENETLTAAIDNPASDKPFSVQSCEKLAGQVDLEGVSFGYSPLDDPLIENFNLHLKPGQWVALVGGSGCGKSTIAKVISGLYKPWEGTISFDGVPIDEVPPAVLRGSLAVVDQDIVTFAGTVADNVTLWDKSIEDYEVIMACRDAGIHQLIADRDGGYSSPVLPGGRNFSGGQLQRLEIARVLAQDPTIIILDEATSALDAQTEAEVIQHIRDREITCVVVAHRLSTIRDCDEIIVLDDGKVVERGTHETLMEANGAYAELVRND